MALQSTMPLVEGLAISVYEINSCRLIALCFFHEEWVWRFSPKVNLLLYFNLTGYVNKKLNKSINGLLRKACNQQCSTRYVCAILYYVYYNAKGFFLSLLLVCGIIFLKKCVCLTYIFLFFSTKSIIHICILPRNIFAYFLFISLLDTQTCTSGALDMPKKSMYIIMIYHE